MKPIIFTTAALLVILLQISGCTYQSGPKTLENKASEKYSANPEARAIIERAIEKTDKEGKKFWYNGSVATKIQKRRTTNMYGSGTFDRDLGYLVTARVMGQEYRYYRYKKDVYVSEGDNWVKASPAEEPPDPFEGFRIILPYAEKARQLPDEQVLGRDCYVFEIPLSGADVGEILQKLGAIANNQTKDSLSEQVEMKYRIWIGKKDSFIYQLKTETLMPVPEAGSMFQEVYFRFWDYNSPSVTLTEPEKIIRYLKED